jgi:hypothetical protein
MPLITGIAVILLLVADTFLWRQYKRNGKTWIGMLAIVCMFVALDWGMTLIEGLK